MSEILDWMERHAIDPYLARDLGLRADGATLIAPYERADGSVFHRIREFPNGTWLQPAGEPLACWWPLGRAYGANVLLLEGEGDCLAAASVIDKSDHPALQICPVALPGVAAVKQAAAELANARTKRAYICLDTDEAGQRAMTKLREYLPEVGVEPWVVSLTHTEWGGKDLADYLKLHEMRAERALAERIQAARHEPIRQPPRREITFTDPETDDLKAIPAPVWIARLAEIEEPSVGALINCPFHEDRTPSCRVKESWVHCFGCGVSGDIFNAGMALWDCDFLTAKNRLREIFGKVNA